MAPRVLSRRPQDEDVAAATATLKGVEVQLLLAVWLFLLGVKSRLEVATLQTERTRDLVDCEVASELTHALAELPPAIHETVPST